jgi:hypothetical protein
MTPSHARSSTLNRMFQPTPENAFMRMPDDQMEAELLHDYAQFAAHLNIDAILTLLQRAAATTDASERKRLCTAGLHLLYISFEDFAILLHAILKRKEGTYLQLTLSGEGQNLGSTSFPNKLKKPGPANELFEELGLTTITADTLQPLGYDITEDTLNDCFSDFAASIKYLATSADEYNAFKNRIKHGKGIFGVTFGLTATDDVAHIEYNKDGTHWVKTTASIQQLQVATITVAKLAVRALDLLSLFMAHYHSDRAPDFVHLAKDHGDAISEQIKTAGLQTKGLG